MKFKHVTSSLLACAAFMSAGVQANSNEDAVHELAQGCYAIQSASQGTFLKKYTKGGAVDDGLS